MIEKKGGGSKWRLAVINGVERKYTLRSARWCPKGCGKSVINIPVHHSRACGKWYVCFRCGVRLDRTELKGNQGYNRIMRYYDGVRP